MVLTTMVVLTVEQLLGNLVQWVLSSRPAVGVALAMLRVACMFRPLAGSVLSRGVAAPALLRAACSAAAQDVSTH